MSNESGNGSQKASFIIISIATICFITVVCVALLIPQNKTSSEETSDASDNYARFVTSLGQYKELSVDVSKEETTQEEIDETFEQFLSGYELPYDEDTDGKVDKGDLVYLDYPIENAASMHIEGVIGKGELPEEYEKAVLGKSVGDEVTVDVAGQSGETTTLKLTLQKVMVPAPITDEFIASLELDGLTTVKALKDDIKRHIDGQHESKFETDKKEALLEVIYNSSAFLDIPDEYVEPFKEVLRKRLDNMVEMYASNGETVTKEQLIEDILKEDTINSVDDYIEAYGLQNARTYAICEKIAENEGLSSDEVDAYDRASSDWLYMTNGEVTLKEFLKDNSIDVYKRAALSAVVENYLLEVSP